MDTKLTLLKKKCFRLHISKASIIKIPLNASMYVENIEKISSPKTVFLKVPF